MGELGLAQHSILAEKVRLACRDFGLGSVPVAVMRIPLLAELFGTAADAFEPILTIIAALC